MLGIEEDAVALLVAWRQFECCFAITTKLDGGADEDAIERSANGSDWEATQEEGLFSGSLSAITGDVVEEGDGEGEEGESTAAGWSGR